MGEGWGRCDQDPAGVCLWGGLCVTGRTCPLWPLRGQQPVEIILTGLGLVAGRLRFSGMVCVCLGLGVGAGYARGGEAEIQGPLRET